jgi:predicted nucleic acid-binding protein
VIVVDSNVVAYLFLPTEHTKRAESLLQREPDWSAPILWKSEFRNILAAYLRRGVLSFEQAFSVQREAEEMLSGFEYDVDSLAVLGLVRSSDCSAYDCEYVALAMQLDTQLVTMDKQIQRAFPSQTMSLS